MPTTRSPTSTGIRSHPGGKWRVHVKVRGRLLSKVFPGATPLTTMRRWREEQRVRSRLGAALPPAGATLREDVATYLAQVQTMPTLRHRTDDLNRWIAVFGRDRIRKSITAGEIRAQLERWRGEDYAPSTCNHRRTALMHLWTVLDGKSAANPARDVPPYHDTSQDAAPRDLPQALADLVLECLEPSQTRARLVLLRWTGWPPATMARLTPEDIRWDQAVRVTARRKGKGAAGRWLSLLPQAWAALREFKRLGCWGSFSTSSARASFRRAARAARHRIARAYAERTIDRADARRLRALLLDVTPYQLRHTFGTLAADATKDERAVQELLQHADIRTTRRYTEGSVHPRVAAAIETIRRKVAPGLHDGAAAPKEA